MRNIYLLSASLLVLACGGERGITNPVTKTCVGTISPSSQVTISSGQTTSVVLDFRNCLSVTVRSDNDPQYVNGVTVSPNATLLLSPSKASTYTITGNGEGVQQTTLHLTVNVVGKPTLSIDGSAIADSGIVLNSTVTFALNKQYISSCSAPVFNGTPTTADPKTVKATASVSDDALVYSPGSTMPVRVNNKRQVTITVTCIGLDGTPVSASITKSVAVPTLRCTNITPDSVTLNWVGNGVLNCIENSITSNNGVDFRGLVGSMNNPWEGSPPESLFITNPGQFQDPNHYAYGIYHFGDPVNFEYDRNLWFKNSERSDAPLKFVLRFRRP